MSKSTDVTLNIKARNLAGRTLDEINAQVEQLAANNDKQATSAERAARSMGTLNTTSRQLAGAYRELTRREGITRSFVEQQQEIKATSQRLTELTAKYREASKGIGTSSSVADMQALGREIIETNDSLNRLLRDNQKASGGLARIGVDASNAAGDLTRLQKSVERAGDAYKASEAEIASYGQTQKRAADIAAEAARRQAEAQREVAAAQQRVRSIGRRGGELAELRADIEARSEAARATDVQAEAARRLAAEQAEGAARQERATQAIREATAAHDAQASRRAQARAAFAAEAAAIDRAASAGERRRNVLLASNRADREAAERKERLAVVLRRLSGETNQNTAALRGNAAASRQAGTNLALFSDVGRKSLGTYQRLRGQILGLTAAYVGFYQVISTAQKAIAATNRNESLMVGLRTVNNGDARAAADDYAYLRKEADRLGLVFDDLAPQYANIAISGKALGLNTTQMRDIFTDTATAAAAMNLSVEDSEGVFRAMTQIMSKGKIQAEELRGQLGDRLPGAVAIFARESGIALEDLDKRFEEGSLGLDVLFKGIEGYADQYANEIDTISNRLQGYINRAKNSYNDFLRSLLTGANDQKLKAAFERIDTFFKSEQGTEFAGALATAFGKAIDVFIALADNIDLVVEAVKIFLGLQLLKFLNDTVIGVVALSKHLKSAGVWMLSLNTATAATTAGVTTLSARLKLLAASMGPVVLALSALYLGFNKIIGRMEEATDRTNDYADALHGLTFAKTEDEITSALKGGQAEAEKLRKEIEALQKAANASAFTNPAYISGQLDRAGVTDSAYLTKGQIEKGLAKRRERLAHVNQGLADSEIKLNKAVADREAREAEERANPLPTLSPDKSTGSASGEKALRNAENQRLNAARAVAKELLDLDQAVLDARLNGEVRTAAQVQQVYTHAVDTIASETEERYLKLQKLAQSVFSAAGVSTPQPSAAAGDDPRAYYDEMVAAAERLGIAEAANLRTLGERVELLRLASNNNAMVTSETQDIEVIERQINDLLDQRASKVQHLNTLREAGQLGEIDAYNAINATQDGYNQRIAALVQTILPLLTAISPEDPRFAWAQKLIADFDILLVKQRQYTVGQRVILALGTQFASGAADAFVTLGKGIAGAIRGTNTLAGGFKAARDAFRTFAADFLQQIAQMIIQAIILQAIQNAINGTSGGYWGAAMSALGGTNHTGGLVGGAGAGPKRKVHAGVFAGAQRFHTGGLPGLRSGEVATILKRGEEVLPEDNPRHIGNAGGAAAEGVTQVIATFDSADVVIQALGNTNVKKRLFAVFNANKSQINQSLRR